MRPVSEQPVPVLLYVSGDEPISSLQVATGNASDIASALLQDDTPFDMMAGLGLAPRGKSYQDPHTSGGVGDWPLTMEDLFREEQVALDDAVADRDVSWQAYQQLREIQQDSDNVELATSSGPGSGTVGVV
ncbi:hypothetical protein SARC_05030 [Sphaeroforma arctica JP610]|uniref:Uncharacterized protein n=1 Tax=Sphaeroforma arctica JP610 TaxID=667725 RepID=A0A0L0G1K1_9EUKA|nr:hypothetical protein SARC_05030 [Sphaeroforma arctica JP610]KNC82691.1 hypothetical protein SARC_05030 [Sphaeroforma arctica JP610]|eukprot:XP_014156593.1 hypothetical protein SARC_05030 [Sphaeroforma arctica JP610]